jgi:hypothetical protein
MDGETGDKRIVMGQMNIGYNEAQIANDGTGRNVQDAGLPDIQTDAAGIEIGIKPSNIAAAAASMPRILLGHGQTADADGFIRAGPGSDTTGEFSASFSNAAVNRVVADKSAMYRALLSARNELRSLTPAAVVRALANAPIAKYNIWSP